MWLEILHECLGQLSLLFFGIPFNHLCKQSIANLVLALLLEGFRFLG